TWEHSWAGTRITFDSDGKLWGYSQYSPFINYKIEDGYVIYIINGVEWTRYKYTFQSDNVLILVNEQNNITYNRV
ncbi:MAG: hypothetical protein MUO82_02490, partial [Candidatus Thermoplasmatota archaeon]|nr:hypothetical protein [Candidatus Thermoplasmatota archaeon]